MRSRAVAGKPPPTAAAIPNRLLHQPSEAAALLDVSISTIRRMIRSGDLDVIRIGVSLRIPRASIQAIAKSQAQFVKAGGDR